MNQEQSSRFDTMLKGHVVVFGGSGGIGSEVVRSFVHHGVEAVTFTYGSNRAGAEALAEEIRDQGVRVYFDSIDQLDESALKTFLGRAVDSIGTEITFGVDSVGISPNKPLEELTVDDFMEVYKINAVRSFFVTKHVAIRMREKAVFGSMALITSSNGINSHSWLSVPYDMSKAAQGHMIRPVAEYFAQWLRTNGVAPGWIATSMNDDPVLQEELKKELGRIWSKRFAHPAEVANYIAFISGPGGSYLCGQNVLLDGGYK